MKSAPRGAGARARGADRAPRGRARRPPIGPPPLLRPRRMQSGRLQPRLWAVHPPSAPPPARSPAPAPAGRPRTIHPGERRGTREGAAGREGQRPRSSPSLPLSQWGSEPHKTGRGQGRAVGLRPEAVGTGQVNLRAAGDGIVARCSPGWVFLGASRAVFFSDIHPRVFLQRDACMDISAVRF